MRLAADELAAWHVSGARQDGLLPSGSGSAFCLAKFTVRRAVRVAEKCLNPLAVKLSSVVVALLVAGLGSLVTPSNAEDPLGDQLGTVRFEVSGTTDVKQHVVRGVKLLHHMMYPEADDEFAAATKLDPQCAFAWWGRAMTLIHPVWPDAPTDDDRKKGAEYLRRGAASQTATPRERAYVETLNSYYSSPAGADYPARLRDLDIAFGRLSDQYPDDLDALAFSALYHLAPARFLPKDRSNRIQLEAARRLQIVLAKIPDHPGAQHYKIHAYDFPMLADRALEVCATYSSIAPDVPHALHMPTHIYTRRGLWEKSIEYNRRSAEAGSKLDLRTGQQSSHFPHAIDYLTYAYLQTGRYAQAEGARDRLKILKGPFAPTQRGAMAFAFAATPARCALEQQQWKLAAQLPLHEPTQFPWGKETMHCDSITYFARAIGAVRSGQLEQARREITELERIRDALRSSKKAAYWSSQSETQTLAARGWLASAEGKPDEAVALLRRAVELESTAEKEAVTPGEVLPAGDLLGDLLLELGRADDAFAAYEAVLVSSPNRLNTLYGAGLSAERLGDVVNATKYFQQLVETAASADANVRRVDHAKAYLTKLASN